MARTKQKKSKFDRAWNRLVDALEQVSELFDTAEENADAISALTAENKTLSKNLAVYEKVLGKALAKLNGKTPKTGKKRGKHLGRPKGSKNAAKKTAKPKTVKATKTIKKTVKPKIVKATKVVKAPVVAPKTETAPATNLPATITK